MEIRCPLCAWEYSPGVRWQCGPDGCGMPFDTFATRGKCPRCEAQFPVTWCPACHQGSAHTRWYVGGHGPPPKTAL